MSTKAGGIIFLFSAPFFAYTREICNLNGHAPRFQPKKDKIRVNTGQIRNWETQRQSAVTWHRLLTSAERSYNSGFWSWKLPTTKGALFISSWTNKKIHRITAVVVCSGRLHFRLNPIFLLAPLTRKLNGKIKAGVKYLGRLATSLPNLLQVYKEKRHHSANIAIFYSRAIPVSCWCYLEREINGFL